MFGLENKIGISNFFLTEKSRVQFFGNPKDRVETILSFADGETRTKKTEYIDACGIQKKIVVWKFDRDLFC